MPLQRGDRPRLWSTMNTPLPTDACIALSTAPNLEVARILAHALVEQRLAACVNLAPQLESIYRWQNAIQQEPEVLLLIKTRTTLWPELLDYLERHHPYSVPELLQVPISNGAPTYLQWLLNETRPASAEIIAPAAKESDS